MALGLFWAFVLLSIFFIVLALDITGFFSKKNHFQVDGKTVVITGGSQGMGRGLGKLLAQKGANVVIVARNKNNLESALEYISGAAAKSTQRFHHISADVTKPEENNRIIREVTEWNHGQPPDIVWANAGMSTPAFLIDTSIDVLRQQMEINYFAAAFLAQSTLKTWVNSGGLKDVDKKSLTTIPARHFIMTSSIAAFVGVAGYSPYSPAKAALRNLSDALHEEVQFYNGARYHATGVAAPEIKIHLVCPGTISSPGLVEEAKTKHPITELLEEGDSVQSEDEVAVAAVKELERGYYLIATNFLGKAMRASSLAGSPRNNWFIDTVFSWVTSLVWLFVQPDMDGKAWKYGKTHGLGDSKGQPA
ncbi:uncharacterized protein IWZ02DRAFT_440701 [Phyllosticta citriasiana]|uniref:3-dehydrosphinganine reductase n=1 Tax=Phyllosticta citriasiana TaxID=595635 RepID=A0ABR1KBZ1_9PEZI